MKLRRVVARNLRRMRRERGLSQEELADRAHLNRNYVGMIERAENAPTVDALEQLSTALNVTLFRSSEAIRSGPIARHHRIARSLTRPLTASWVERNAPSRGTRDLHAPSVRHRLTEPFELHLVAAAFRCPAYPMLTQSTRQPLSQTLNHCNYGAPDTIRTCDLCLRSAFPRLRYSAKSFAITRHPIEQAHFIRISRRSQCADIRRDFHPAASATLPRKRAPNSRRDRKKCPN